MTLILKSDREIELSRVFDAPKRLVFEACSKPQHIRQWWGRHGHTMTGCEMDFRPGGAWRFVMRDAQGAEFAFRGEYREIVPGERIVQTFEFEGFPGAISLETMTLTEHEGRTTLTVTSRFDSIEARNAMVESGMEHGAAETYDRLEAHVRSLA